MYILKTASSLIVGLAGGVGYVAQVPAINEQTTVSLVMMCGALALMFKIGADSSKVKGDIAQLKLDREKDMTALIQSRKEEKENFAKEMSRIHARLNKLKCAQCDTPIDDIDESSGT